MPAHQHLLGQLGSLRLTPHARRAFAAAAVPPVPQRAQSCARGLRFVSASTETRFRIPLPTEDIVTIDDIEVQQRLDRGHVVRLVQWYPGHIARAEKQLKEQLRLVDVVLDVRDSRIPLATGHPMLPGWIGNKLRLVVMNQMDKISQREQSRWATYFSTQRNTRVIFTNGQSGEGVTKLMKAATSVSGELNNRRREKGLKPRPVRVAVVGFPNVGKSALINRLIGKRQVASAQRPGVTRHLQWVTLGAEGEVMLLDAPGILPMRLADQEAAVRLAICNDIGEASYTTSLVAADFIEQLRTHEDAKLRMKTLETRYKFSIEGLAGDEFIAELAEKVCAGDKERAGRKILKDYQQGFLGAFGLEQVPKQGDDGSSGKDYRTHATRGSVDRGAIWTAPSS